MFRFDTIVAQLEQRSNRIEQDMERSLVYLEKEYVEHMEVVRIMGMAVRHDGNRCVYGGSSDKELEDMELA